MFDDGANDVSLTYRMQKMLAGIGNVIERIMTVLACKDVVLSMPFFKDDKWMLISGDSIGYRMISFDSAEAANTEFTAFGNLVTFGDAMFDFYLLSSDEAGQVENQASYFRVLERHRKAAYRTRRLGEAA
jgi:hypothetical protein